MTPFENYLTRLREIRSSGEAVDETSYYDALSNFFNEIGKSPKPRVHCILQLKNRGAGNPDGGLFTEDQLKKRQGEENFLPQNPARGASEIKPAKDDACVTVFPIPHFYRQHDLLWVWKHLPAAERRNASAAFGSMVMKKDAPKCDDASIEAD